MGVGEARLNRWYYTANTRTCAPFTYAGTKGNQNNFLSKADCEGRCPGLFLPFSGEYSRWTRWVLVQCS